MEKTQLQKSHATVPLNGHKQQRGAILGPKKLKPPLQKSRELLKIAQERYDYLFCPNYKKLYHKLVKSEVHWYFYVTVLMPLNLFKFYIFVTIFMYGLI